MKTSWNQMIVLGSAALFFTAYATQNAAAQGQAVETPKKELLNETNEMQSLVPGAEESQLTPEERARLLTEEEYVFDEQVPG